MDRAHRRAVRLVVPLLVLGGLAACTPGSPTSSTPTPSASTARPSAGATTSGPTSTPTTGPTDGAPPASPEPTDAAPAPAPAPDDLTEVTVTISYAGWVADAGRVEVGAYVDGVIEGTGTCTLTLKRSGRSVSETVPATADASSTSCGAVAVDGAQLSSGTWSAVVDYDSPTSVGSSAPTEVVVP
ncbi:hypothetical protein [Cellulomonas xylanilytica]|uniref:Bacterial spore germination immunoglobulin-like domain-containing protein n=1 Tax=Cellulomonas xylanilytica TaxID=233583 RepID=A0A510V455_9CELL|nr:hypothetical protein [Cellulomonas xylanilytica]GEK21662.1 hypothetical protein CXY01_21820 [Cellulomonas xylanilytica]